MNNCYDQFIKSFTNQNAWSFYYYSGWYSKDPGQPPKLIEGESAKEVLCKLLKLPIDTTDYKVVTAQFEKNLFAPTDIYSPNEGRSLNAVCLNLLYDLYCHKVIDAHLYYHFKFMTNGLAPFLFRGRNPREIMESFRVNYRKALSPNCDRDSNSSELLKKLNNAFISLGFGANGVDLHEMISFNFVEPVMLDKLKEVSQFTINKYKRAY